VTVGLYLFLIEPADCGPAPRTEPVTPPGGAHAVAPPRAGRGETRAPVRAPKRRAMPRLDPAEDPPEPARNPLDFGRA
jgi:hypothetical protein